jgi:hypothetical protein
MVMAMRAPGSDGAADVEAAGGAEQEGLEADHPVMLAFLNAALDDEPMTEGETRALEEWRSSHRGVDSRTVTSLIAERARREG